MEKKSSVDWKKLSICFLIAIIAGVSFIIYMETSTPKAKNIIMWSLDEDLCVAVEAPFDGDVFDAGTYHFYQDYVDTPRKAKAWDIYVGHNPNGLTSKIKDMEYIGIVGTYENKEITIDIPKGKYIYMKHRGGENFEGILEVDLTPHKN